MKKGDTAVWSRAETVKECQGKGSRTEAGRRKKGSKLDRGLNGIRRGTETCGWVGQGAERPRVQRVGQMREVKHQRAGRGRGLRKKGRRTEWGKERHGQRRKILQRAERQRVRG